MTFQLGVATRNALLDAIETQIGTSPIMRMYTGSEPANCAASATGTKLYDTTLPSDWMNAASSGSKTLNGSWTGTTSGGGGTIGYFRILESTGTTCYIQGSVGLGSGDLSLNNNVVADGQTLSITTFTLTAGNA